MEDAMSDEQKNEDRDDNDKNLLTEELPGGGLTHEEFDNAGNGPRKRTQIDEEDDESDDE
jgi:hypothetical protein